MRFFASQCLTAQETERKKIAAELHDSIAASLVAINSTLKGFNPRWNRAWQKPNPCQVWSQRFKKRSWKPEESWRLWRPAILDEPGDRCRHELVLQRVSKKLFLYRPSNAKSAYRKRSCLIL